MTRSADQPTVINKGTVMRLGGAGQNIITNTPIRAPIQTTDKTRIALERGSSSQEIGVYVAAIVTKIMA